MKGIFKQIKDEFSNAKFIYSDSYKEDSKIEINNVTIYYNDEFAFVVVSHGNDNWTFYPYRKLIKTIIKDIHEAKTIHI